MKDISIAKVFDYCVIKIEQIRHEKKYVIGGGQPIKYLLFRNPNSDKLIVCFSSLTRKGVSARYNYVRTLKQFNVNKIFILDDNGPEHRGCYCLGHNRDYSVERDTFSLINMMKEQMGIKHTVYCGSSKGGWCALNFGLEDYNSDIIVGAPQYLLGNYFKALPDIRLEEWVFGENWNEFNISELNDKIRNKVINNNKHNNRIYIHISDQEHTYKEHVQYLIKDLADNGYEYSTDIKHYPDHGEIVKYFPEYLKKTIKEIIR